MLIDNVNQIIKYLSDYDKNKDSSYLIYLDANVMSQPLPTGGFKWLREDKWDDIFKNKEGTGYFIEFDLEYPTNDTIYITITPLSLKN